jgi:hypothetical protein
VAFTTPSGERTDIAAAKGKADHGRPNEFAEGREDPSPVAERDVLQRLLLSSFATHKADQR